jgi:hypothetical protein
MGKKKPLSGAAWINWIAINKKPQERECRNCVFHSEGSMLYPYYCSLMKRYTKEKKDCPTFKEKK